MLSILSRNIEIEIVLDFNNNFLQRMARRYPNRACYWVHINSEPSSGPQHLSRLWKSYTVSRTYPKIYRRMEMNQICSFKSHDLFSVFLHFLPNSCNIIRKNRLWVLSFAIKYAIIYSLNCFVGYQYFIYIFVVQKV